MQQYIISKHSYFNFKGIHMNKIAAFQFLILTFLFTSKGITQTCTVGNAVAELAYGITATGGSANPTNAQGIILAAGTTLNTSNSASLSDATPLLIDLGRWTAGGATFTVAAQRNGAGTATARVEYSLNGGGAGFVTLGTLTLSSATSTHTNFTVPSGGSRYFRIVRTGAVNLFVDGVSYSHYCPSSVAIKDDIVVLSPGTAVGNVTGNDKINGNIIQLTQLTSPTNGTLSFNSTTGMYTYMPNMGYEGLDFWNYQLCDPGPDGDIGTTGDNNCTTATVTFRTIFNCKTTVFYVPMPENEARDFLEDINTGNDDPTTVYIGVALSGEGFITYDHWEDGYEVDITFPMQATTQIWGDGDLTNGVAPGFPNDMIPPGKTVILTNTLTSGHNNTNTYNPNAPGADNTLQSVVDYDGRDKLYIAGEASMAKFAWGTTGTVSTSSSAVPPTRDWGTDYVLPVGTNTANAGNMFDLASLSIMAMEDNTTVNIDRDANGSIDLTMILNEGETYYVDSWTATQQPILEGATISATAPVQVMLMSGDQNSSYAGRTFALVPTNMFASTYYMPTVPLETMRVYFYNPTGSNITVTRTTNPGPTSTNITVPPMGTAFDDVVNFGNGYEYTSTVPFGILSAVDFNGTISDWGFTPIPETNMSPVALLSFAEGSDPTNGAYGTNNYSQAFITPKCNTYIYVDLNGDGSPDHVSFNDDTDSLDVSINIGGINYNETTSNQGILVNKYQTITIGGTNGSLNGAKIWSRTGPNNTGPFGCDLAVVWGQNGGPSGAPNIDAGYTLPKTPLPLDMDVDYPTSVCADNNTESIAILALNGIPPYTILVLNKTTSESHIISTMSATSTFDASNPGNYVVKAHDTNCLEFELNFTVLESADCFADLSITKTDFSPTYAPGQPVIYTVVVNNAGPLDAFGTTITDTAPAGTTISGWNAVFSGGATGMFSGSGNINAMVNMPVGGSITYTITVTVPSNYTGNLVNTATVTAPANAPDPNLGNNTATDTDTSAPLSELSITKSDGVGTYTAGTTTTYTVVVDNNGPSDALGATVTDNAPGSSTITGWTAVFTGGASGTANGSGNINQSVNLPVGGEITYTITLNIPSGFTGNLVNTANVAVPVGTTDPIPGNNSATDTDTPAPVSDLSITKTDGVATYTAGTTTTYTVVASNAGPSNVIGALITDNAPAGTNITTWTATFAGGASGTANGSGNISQNVNLPVGGTATYTITLNIQSNVTGNLVNTATVAVPVGTTDPTPGNNSATDTDTPNPQADLSITKTDGTPTYTPGVGTTYTVTATNNGPSDVVGASIIDNAPSGTTITSWSAIFSGGASGTTNGTGNISQIVNLPDGGSVSYIILLNIPSGLTGNLVNTASVAVPPGTTDPTPGNNSATDTDTPNPQADLSITKTDGSPTYTAGVGVVYTVVVSNAGPSNVTGATVVDNTPAGTAIEGWTAVFAGGASGVASGSGNINQNVTIPVGGTITYTISLLVPSGFTGNLVNTATIVVPVGTTDPTPGNNSATDTDTPNPVSDLGIVKTVDNSNPSVGNNVTFTLLVTNYGPSDATGVQVSDLLPNGYTYLSDNGLGAYDNMTGVWAIGNMVHLASTSLQITATVNQPGLGVVYLNTATVSGNETDPVPGNNTDDEPTLPVSLPSIVLLKTGTYIDNAPIGYNAGDQINYTYVATNTGNVTLTGVTVVENSFSGTGGIPVPLFVSSTLGSTAGTLIPTESATYSALYTITQADIDAGHIDNQGLATGTPPIGGPVTDLSDSNDPLLTGPDDPTETPLPQTPSISLIKGSSLDMGVDGIATPGDVITYTYLATNTGNVTLTSVTVVENNFSGTGGIPVPGFMSSTLGSPVGTLLPGESATYTVNYNITLADINAGQIDNQGLATGTPPIGGPVTDLSDSNDPLLTGPDDPTETPLPQTPSISLIKGSSLDMGVDGIATPGDVITYTYVATNTGNVTLTGVTVVENNFSGTGGIPVPAFVSSTLGSSVGTLLPGESAIYTTTYNITLADVNAGIINNQGLAEGTSPLGVDVDDLSDSANIADPNETGTPGNSTEDDPTGTPLPQTPSISLIKGSSLNLGVDGIATPGDVITYTYVATNTGNVTLTGVTVVENSFSGTGGTPVPAFVSSTLGSLAGTLLPGESATYTVNYNITLADINAGQIDNQGLATGTPPIGGPVTDLSDSNDPLLTGPDDPTETPLPQTPSISLIKGSSLDMGVDGIATPGDVITYTYVTTNTGNVTLTSVTVVENNFSGTGAIPVPVFVSSTLGSSVGTLLPGESATYTVNYNITQTDINAGIVNNQGLTEGTSPLGVDVNDLSDSSNMTDPNETGTPSDPLGDDPTGTALPQLPVLGIAKTITSGPINNNDGSYNITYRILLENMGNVTLNNVQAIDYLSTTFTSAVSYTVVTTSSTDFVINSSYDGSTDANVLMGTDVLVVGASGTVDITVQVVPGAFLGIYNNSATGLGISPLNALVSDVSQNGTDVDPDNDGNPGNNSQPTPVSFTENPGIGIAKQLTNGPVNNNDGTYNIEYTLRVANTGDVPLHNFQVVEDLGSVFSPAIFQVNSVTSPTFTLNPLFDGMSDVNLIDNNQTLIYAETGIIVINLTITPGTNLGPYNNTANAQGISPASVYTDDDSDSGTNATDDVLTGGDNPGQPGDTPGGTDDPTPVIFTENPVIGVSKLFSDGPHNNGDQSYTLEFSLNVENLGDVPLNNVQVTDDLDATFIGATSYIVNGVSSSPNLTVNPGFNGSTDKNLLLGVDNFAYLETGTITITVTVRPGANPAFYNNMAIATGTSIAGTNVTDSSQDGTDVDPNNNDDPTDDNDPTPIPIPAIALLKTLTSSVLQPSGDVRLIFDFMVHNIGNVSLASIILEDELVFDAALSSTPDINVSVININANQIPSANTNYDGVTDIELITGASNLSPGQKFRVTLSVDVNPILFSQLNSSLQVNQATVFGTPVNQIGQVLQNPSTGVSYTDREVTDKSDDTTGLPMGDPNGTNDGSEGDGIGPNPYDNPTPIVIPSSIKVWKSISDVNPPIQLLNGNYQVKYDLSIINDGGQILTGINLIDDISMQYGCAFVGNASDPLVSLINTSLNSVAPTGNIGFTGSGVNSNMLIGDGILYPGDTVLVSFNLEIQPSCINPAAALQNQATASGTDEMNVVISDQSDDTTDLNQDGNPDNPGVTEDDPTILNINSVDVSKAVTTIIPAALKGNYIVGYSVSIQNTGNTYLTNVSLVDDLAAQLGTAFVGNVSMTGISGNANILGGLNPSYNGNGNNEMLDQNGAFHPGEVITVTFEAEIDASGITDPKQVNSVLGTATTPTNGTVNDLSENGVDPSGTDVNMDGTPDTPTPLPPLPTVVIAKQVTGLTEAASGIVGNYDVAYQMEIENIGSEDLTNLVLTDNLQSQFGAVFVGITGQPAITGGTATMNPVTNGSYTGGTDNMFNGTSGLLEPGQTITVTLRVEVNPNADPNLLILNNQATILGYAVDGSGNPILGSNGSQLTATDVSDSGAIPDSTNPGEPGDTGTPDDPTPLQVPSIHVVKNVVSVTKLANSNYNVRYRLKVGNTGNTVLENITLVDDIVTQLGSAYVSVATAPSINVGSTTAAVTPTLGVFPMNIFNGTSGRLNPGQVVEVEFVIQVNPDAAGAPDPLDNQATTGGIPTNGNGVPLENPNTGSPYIPGQVTDDSDSGVQLESTNPGEPGDTGGPDDPTPVIIPSVDIAKQVTGLTEAASGIVGNYDVNYTMVLKNTGNTDLANLRLTDNLQSQFGVVFVGITGQPAITGGTATMNPVTNGSYTGGADNMFNGTSGLLEPGQTITVTLRVEVNPNADPNLLILNNQATILGYAVDGSGNPILGSNGSQLTATDVSDSGAIPDSTNPGEPGDTGTPDDPTPLQVPSIQVVKNVVSVTKLANSNYNVRYRLRVGNTGNTVLENITLTDDIIGQLGSAYVSVVTAPSINVGSTTAAVTPTLGVFPMNIFNGTSGRLNPGQVVEVEFVIQVNPDAAGAPDPLDNQATTGGIPTNGSGVPLENPNTGSPYIPGQVTDDSDSGVQLESTNPGEPGDTGGPEDPTPVQIPSIDVVKSIINVTDAVSQIPGNKDVTFRFTVQNSGNLDLTGIDLINPVMTELLPVWVGIVQMPNVEFSNATSTPVLNGIFNGNSQPNMFNGSSGLLEPGQLVTVELTVQINPNATHPNYPALTNQATANGDATLFNGSVVTVTDISDDGINPQGTNPDYPGDTGTPNDPTPLIAPAISLVKNVVDYQNPLSGISGHYDVIINLGLKNVGNVHLSNIRLMDTIELNSYVGPYYVGLAPGTQPVILSSNATTNPIINVGFSGRVSNPGIFNGTTGQLAPGQEMVVQIRIEIDATSPMIPDSLWNRASVYGYASRSNGTLYIDPVTSNPISTSDNSDAGTLHESTNPDQPEDDGTAYDNTLIEVLGQIGDFVWKDMDGDGIQDVGESGVGGVVVGLYDCSNNLIRSVTTGSDGKYILDNVLRGFYRLRFDISGLPPGCAFTNKNSGNNVALDSDADLEGWTDCFFINPGQRDTTTDAGLVILSAIGDFVWHDLNGDGQQNAGEPGISGVQVNLWQGTGAYVATTYTDASGMYLFDFIRPGNYYLQYVTPAGYEFTFYHRGNDNTDSDVDGGNGPGRTSTTYLSPGERDLTWDAGFYRCVPIGDLVWYDINKNDVWNTNENGINGLKVNLWKNHLGNWLIWDFKYTGQKPGSPSDDGYFGFCVPPGEYYVEVIMPPLGLVRSRPNIGSNREIDSDIKTNGKTDVFIVQSGNTKTDLGAGFYPMALVGNLVWRDDNLNGIQEASEARVEGVKVEAVDISTGKVAATSYTDASGVYMLDYLEKQQYYFKFTPPTGFGATMPRATMDNMDSDVDHSFGPNTTRAISMEPSMVNENIDFGIAFGILPVDWLDVNARRVNNVHLVTWSTSREVNVSHYEVERKFESDKEFATVPGRVDSKGNTNLISNYSLTDFDVEKSGVYIYRVKQIDLDGQYTYSRLVKVNYNGDTSIDIYPNPAKNETNIQLVLTQDSEVKIELLDATSKLVKVLRKQSVEKAGDMIHNVDLQDIVPGVYNVLITIDEVTVQRKLIRIE